MAKVVELEIKHFRKFEDLKCTFGMTSLVCLIGRGDAGKSTLLDALSYVLSPSRFVQVSDYDFTGCDTTTPIQIRVVVVEFDESLLRADKYGYYQCGWDEASNQLCDVEQGDEKIQALIIELTIDASLEPKWEVVNPVSGERKMIGFKDRSLLNVSLISDYLNRHFAWANGSPLATLTHEAGEELDQGVLQKISRMVRAAADGMDFGNFGEILSSISSNAGELGAEAGTLRAAFDIKQMAIRDGAVCLHDEHKLPLRLRGKGSKRLLSVAIQAAVSGDTGIALIDEVEQGLEPDRVRSFVHTLMRRTKGQVFLTTHSQNVLVEVNARNVFWVRDEKVMHLTEECQGLLRKFPAAFFGKKIVLCEGKTELGFCKALDEYLNEKDQQNFSRGGVVLVMGRGDEFKKNAESFLKLGVKILLFCDADCAEQNAWKEELKKKGVKIVSWGNGDSIEEGLVRDLPDKAVASLLGHAADLKGNEMDAESARRLICDGVRGEGGEIKVEHLFNASSYDSNLRAAIGRAAKKKGNNGHWFKTETGGGVLGRLVCEYVSSLGAGCCILNNVQLIFDWIKDA